MKKWHTSSVDELGIKKCYHIFFKAKCKCFSLIYTLFKGAVIIYGWGRCVVFRYSPCTEILPPNSCALKFLPIPDSPNYEKRTNLWKYWGFQNCIDTLGHHVRIMISKDNMKQIRRRRRFLFTILAISGNCSVNFMHWNFPLPSISVHSNFAPSGPCTEIFAFPENTSLHP